MKSEEKKRDKERSVSIAGKPETPVTPGGTAPAVVQSIEHLIDAPEQATPGAPGDTQESKGQPQGDAAQPSEAPQGDGLPMPADDAQPEVGLVIDSLWRSRPNILQGKIAAEALQKRDPNGQDPAADPSIGDVDAENKQDGKDGQGGAHEGQDAHGEGEKQSENWNAGANGATAQGQMFGNGFGFDPNQAGFNGMNWGAAGNFNPMMMNGMPNGAWNNFGMMGKPSYEWSPCSSADRC